MREIKLNIRVDYLVFIRKAINYLGLGIIIFILLTVASLLSTCAVRLGMVHTVRQGETLWEISRAYDVSLDTLLRINNIKDPRQIMPGDKINIPRRLKDQKQLASGLSGKGGIPSSSSQAGKQNISKTADTTTEMASKIRASDTSKIPNVNFSPVWPCEGRLISRFEPGGDPTKNGILIHPPSGAPVKAAEAGRVKMAGLWDSLPELGKIIIIVHNQNFVTVYAHLSKTSVSEGDQVNRGEKIGVVGKSGTTEKKLCYFEIRYKLEPRDPLLFLGESG